MDYWFNKKYKINGEKYYYYNVKRLGIAWLMRKKVSAT